MLRAMNIEFDCVVKPKSNFTTVNIDFGCATHIRCRDTTRATIPEAPVATESCRRDIRPRHAAVRRNHAWQRDRESRTA